MRGFLLYLVGVALFGYFVIGPAFTFWFPVKSSLTNFPKSAQPALLTPFAQQELDYINRLIVNDCVARGGVIMTTVGVWPLNPSDCYPYVSPR